MGNGGDNVLNKSTTELIHEIHLKVVRIESDVIHLKDSQATFAEGCHERHDTITAQQEEQFKQIGKNRSVLNRIIGGILVLGAVTSIFLGIIYYIVGKGG